MPDDNDKTLAEAAQEPAEVTVDGQTVKQHKLADQIEADRYLASKDAARKGLGMRMTKVVPPGAA